MIRINQIKLPLESDKNDLYKAAAKALRISIKRIESLNVYKKSLDSRKKEKLFFVYSVDVTVSGDENKVLSGAPNSNAVIIEPLNFVMPPNKRMSKFRPVIVGFGPAGMFAGLTLARAGLKPLIIERGKDVDSRKKDVQNFFDKRILNESSNVQFGEGGAGTFSDGKLTTGIKDTLCRKILIDFHKFGAPEEILYSSKAHIGTDKLTYVVKNIRKEIISLGGEVLFESKLTSLIVANGVVHGITYTDKSAREIDIETDALILCTGHSARDTVEMLYNKGITMMQKPFSVGTRIEHPREMIDKAQYGSFAGHRALGAADYKLSCHSLHERGAYTFCMCPGGTVVAAASEEGGVVVNGMSNFARDGENSNSAILVGISTDDFPDSHVLSGFKLQRDIEEKAFLAGGGDYRAPAQLVGDFLENRASSAQGAVNPSCPTGVKFTNISCVLPEKVTQTIRGAIIKMDSQLKGFALPDAVLTAPETRSSSPVRILRDEYYQTNIRGVYPCGEGAGYAGGIVSAGVDGIRCAYAVMSDEF